MIILSWIIDIILSSGLFISSIPFQYEPESCLCILTRKVFRTSFPVMTIAFIIPVIIIIILYGGILWHTTRTNRIHSNSIAIGNNKRNIKVFKRLVLAWEFRLSPIRFSPIRLSPMAKFH
jgi:hypothetical protein